jgi:hypothetical protein
LFDKSSFAMLRYAQKHTVSHTNGNFFGVNVQYHVFLQGKQLGPYDKRTIVGMRIKKTLTNADVLIDEHDQQISVGQLLGKRSRPARLDMDIGSSAFDALQSGAYSPVVGIFTVPRMQVSKGLRDVPRFVGAVQARVHTDLLRLAGTSRALFKRKEGRVKLPFGQILRVQQLGANLALWVRTDARLNAQLEGAPSITLMLQSADDVKALLAAVPEQVERVQTPAAGTVRGGGSAFAKQWPLSNDARAGVMLVGALGAVLAVFVALLFFRR